MKFIYIIRVIQILPGDYFHISSSIMHTVCYVSGTGTLPIDL